MAPPKHFASWPEGASIDTKIAAVERFGERCLKAWRKGGRRRYEVMMDIRRFLLAHTEADLAEAVVVLMWRAGTWVQPGTEEPITRGLVRYLLKIDTKSAHEVARALQRLSGLEIDETVRVLIENGGIDGARRATPPTRGPPRPSTRSQGRRQIK